jgi:hypothetical protein
MVMGTNQTVTLKRPDAYSTGRFENCIVTKEWSDLEKGSIEQKSYCPGIGNVLVEEHHGKVLRSELTSGPATSSTDPFQFRKVPGE